MGTGVWGASHRELSTFCPNFYKLKTALRNSPLNYEREKDREREREREREGGRGHYTHRTPRPAQPWGRLPPLQLEAGSDTGSAKSLPELMTQNVNTGSARDQSHNGCGCLTPAVTRPPPWEPPLGIYPRPGLELSTDAHGSRLPPGPCHPTWTNGGRPGSGGGAWQGDAPCASTEGSPEEVTGCGQTPSATAASTGMSWSSPPPCPPAALTTLGGPCPLACLPPLAGSPGPAARSTKRVSCQGGGGAQAGAGGTTAVGSVPTSHHVAVSIPAACALSSPGLVRAGVLAAQLAVQAVSSVFSHAWPGRPSALSPASRASSAAGLGPGPLTLLGGTCWKSYQSHAPPEPTWGPTTGGNAGAAPGPLCSPPQPPAAQPSDGPEGHSV